MNDNEDGQLRINYTSLFYICLLEDFKTLRGYTEEFWLLILWVVLFC